MGDNRWNIGERLANARRNLGLTQTEASVRAGIPRGTLSAMERGRRVVDGEELLRLAKAYGKTPGDLVGEERSGENGVELVRRLTPRSRDTERVLALLRESVTIEGVIESPLRYGQITWTPSDPQNELEAARRGERMALNERAALGLGVSPIANMAGIASRRGVRVVELPFPVDVSGVCLNDPEIGEVILINSDYGEFRRKLATAHEYLHALADRGGMVAPCRSSDAGTLREIRANAFAWEFLAPAEGILTVLGELGKGERSRSRIRYHDPSTGVFADLEARTEPRFARITAFDVAFVASEYGLDFESAAYRLWDAGAIGGERRDELREMGSDVLSLSESLAPARSTGRWLDTLEKGLVRLAVEALRLDGISEDRFVETCELAGLTIGRAKELVSLARM